MDHGSGILHDFGMTHILVRTVRFRCGHLQIHLPSVKQQGAALGRICTVEARRRADGTARQSAQRYIRGNGTLQDSGVTLTERAWSSWCTRCSRECWQDSRPHPLFATAQRRKQRICSACCPSSNPTCTGTVAPNMKQGNAKLPWPDQHTNRQAFGTTN